MYSRLSNPIILLILAALSGTLAMKAETLPDWGRLFLILCAIILGIAGVIGMIDLVTILYIDRIRDLGFARLRPTMELANSLIGQSPGSLDLLSRHAILDVRGLLGEDQVLWTVKFLHGDMPLDFIGLFLTMSQDTAPFLWPVRRHDEIVFKDYVNVEDKLTQCTKEFILRGWAEQHAGPYAAKLKDGITLDYLADRVFQIEIGR